MDDLNFLIVGAPKCGTTALAQYLGEHPDIYVTSPKEPHFFLCEKDRHRKITTLAHYRAILEKGHNCIVSGEASVWYLFSDHAREEIFRYNPFAKIIILVREPAEFVASLHAQLVFGGYEADPELERAWERERKRKAGIPANTIEEIPGWRTRYRELIRMREYAVRYVERFGDENVLILNYEALVADAGSVYRKTLEFLDIEDNGREDFPPVNVRKAHRSRVLGRLLHAANRQKIGSGLARRAKSALGVGSLGIVSAVKRFNIKTVPRRTIPERLRSEINGMADTGDHD
ncbi:sulfotransferase family protein [Halofilum ochraceum]|uniref:sulfotransferase family protein n=1 Tax=Halofilum ochraceum TaxID=1611323 RepID=UPI0008322E4C|nr:sulfotransferase [Halofilum ochraceum]